MRATTFGSCRIISQQEPRVQGEEKEKKADVT